MKALFTTPIKSLEEAHAFFRALVEEHLLFHPEDSPDTIVDGFGRRLFNAEEATLLAARIAEVYEVDPDPCKFIVDNLLPKSTDP